MVGYSVITVVVAGEVLPLTSVLCLSPRYFNLAISLLTLCLFPLTIWTPGQTFLFKSLDQRFPNFLTRGALFRINFYGGAPQAYPMSYKLMVFRSSVTAGGRGDR